MRPMRGRLVRARVAPAGLRPDGVGGCGLAQPRVEHADAGGVDAEHEKTKWQTITPWSPHGALSPRNSGT